MLNRAALLLSLTASLCLAGENNWNAKAAAGYLDARAEWWMAWPNASRDHATFCVSCHTAVPYALSRPYLRKALGESAESPTEQKLLANVSKRVNLWSETKPFYFDSPKAPNRSAESRSTEAVLNVLVLAASNHAPDLKAALNNMWATQLPDGGFLWIDFHNRPWEADDSRYYGSAIAAVAAGTSPAELSSKEQTAKLVDYLRLNYQSQSLANKVIVLWAQKKLPQLLTGAEEKSLLGELTAAQNQDGGWSLTSLAGTWKRADGTPLQTASDGYATGLILYAMAGAGVPKTDKSIKSGIEWLTQNQSLEDGRWMGYSLNKNRDLQSDVGRFMSDAATAYAVLALTQ